MVRMNLFFIVLLAVGAIKSSPVYHQSNSAVHRSKRGTPAADWKKQRWPNATVFYVIDENLASIQEDLLRAMQQIEAVSCVRYVPRTDQIDYVVFENNTLCKEPVGRQGGEQKILINIPECGNLGFFLHAAMQVLGFYHEHQRFDRDEYVTIFEENIDPDWLDWSFRKLDSSTHFYNSTYDPHSIMHYGSYQFSINGKPTILAKDGTELIPWTAKSALTKLDKEAINDYYGCNRNSRAMDSMFAIAY